MLEKNHPFFYCEYSTRVLIVQSQWDYDIPKGKLWVWEEWGK